MKKVAVVFVWALFCFSLLAGKAVAADKFGYVDLGRIFGEYSKTKDYDKTLAGKEQVYTAEREKKLNELKQIQEKLNLLSDKEKEAKKPEIESKVKAFQDFDRQKQLDLRKDQDEKLKEIMKDIEEAVKIYAEKEGFTFVMDDRLLIYKTKAQDVTDKVLDQLNKGLAAAVAPVKK